MTGPLREQQESRAEQSMSRSWLRPSGKEEDLGRFPEGRGELHGNLKDPGVAARSTGLANSGHDAQRQENQTPGEVLTAHSRSKEQRPHA